MTFRIFLWLAVVFMVTNGIICVPFCKQECIHGTCSFEGCRCFNGWRGDSCEDSIFCINTRLSPLNFTDTSKQLSKSIKIHDVNKFQIGWGSHPKCDTKCLDQIDNIAVNFSQSSANFTQYFILVDLPCNVVAATSWSSAKIGGIALVGVIGIVILVHIVYVLYVAQKQRGLKNATTSDNSSQTVDFDFESDAELID